MGSLTQVDFTAGDVVRPPTSLCFTDHARCFAIAEPLSCAAQYGYRMGKAALHIAGVTLARDFKKIGIPVGLIHPGVVSQKT